uniref:RING-type E3 ubiquitin transferase n=1 Tax=Setaria viridis TaxID=4556 RepID=A0A4U6V4F9_SETVI|nr:RING-H2 finger protein ATL43-like [Setaria viridis]TKW21739.1 hypothetical protein SEVIR_4G141000v2 [Setaria viridis]
MSLPLPPGFNLPPIALPPPPPPPPSNNNNSVMAALTIAFGIFVFVIFCGCILSRKNRDGDEAEATEAAADLAAPPWATPSSVPVPPEPWENDEQHLRRPRSGGGEGRPRRVSPAAGLPSFTYSRSVTHNVTGGGGEEAATCSVCLGAFQTGETVRLLPVCLHLYHVECIDPWLDAHSTCPVCRSGTDPATDGRLHLPV